MSGRVVAIHLGLLLALTGSSLRAEDGSAAWLRYAPLSNPSEYKSIPSRIVIAGDSSTERAAATELQKGLSSMLGRRISIIANQSSRVRDQEDTILLSSYKDEPPSAQAPNPDSYKITFVVNGAHSRLTIAGRTPRAELYGAFHLLEEIGAARPIQTYEEEAPAAIIRWSDEWDNLDGTVERGYAGRSIFFENGQVRADLSRAGAYARLLASVGINGCNVNNVNADLDILTTGHLHELARIADAFRTWGVRLALSVDMTSPQSVGGLPTFDPLDPLVVAWWKQKCDEIYALIPDFGGFTVKADSEGRKGPSQYGRTPVDAANVLAHALSAHGGVVLYRGFVYNNHLDWQDPKADRARAGVDNFARYDGLFAPNVIIQIKEGPIDFQAREPVSPLFAALQHTNVAMELQTSQEYTGQQRDMVWLPSMWKWVLDTDMRVENRRTPLKGIIDGKDFPSESNKPRTNGFISVTNVGDETNWLHHPMALANLYGFGKLSWNPDEPLVNIIDSWTRLTWGNDPQVVRAIVAMQLKSWSIYEGYTGPNGMGTLTDILGYHFGPGIESAERNGWGQWFRAESDGIGMDRTASGTGYAQQYPPQLASVYNSLKTCPDDLLLFFHHVPYDYKLRTGETLVQSIYDTHYASARAAANYVPEWIELRNKVDPERYAQTLALFEYQAGQAVVWRDAINHWFQRISRIDDASNRIGHDPNRIEAEDMQSIGYRPVEVTPWETASGGKAMVCAVTAGCSLNTVVHRAPGSYNVAVQYFDTWRGDSRYELLVNDHSIATWQANDTLPPAQFDPHLDGQDSTRFTARNVALKPGDKLTIRGIPDLRPQLAPNQRVPADPGSIRSNASERQDYREYAPIDYVAFGPAGAVTPQ